MVSTKMKKLSQTIIYLPHFMSWVVTAGVFGMLFAPTSAGLVNQVLIKMGLIEKEIYFLGDNDWWRFSYYIINIWHDTGWGTIIFMATLTGIDPGIYEAASIDGAGRWKKMRYITLPALANTIVTVLVLNLAKIMNLFESVFVLQNAAVYKTSQVLQTYVYYQTFNSGGNVNFGYTTAIGLFRSLVGMALVLICNHVSKKIRAAALCKEGGTPSCKQPQRKQNFPLSRRERKPFLFSRLSMVSSSFFSACLSSFRCGRCWLTRLT